MMRKQARSLPCSVIQEKGTVFLFTVADTLLHSSTEQHKCVTSVSATSRFLFCSGFHKGQGQVSGQLGLLGGSGKNSRLLAESRSCGCSTEVTTLLLIFTWGSLSLWRPLASAARGSCTPGAGQSTCHTWNLTLLLPHLLESSWRKLSALKALYD